MKRGYHHNTKLFCFVEVYATYISNFINRQFTVGTAFLSWPYGKRDIATKTLCSVVNMVKLFNCQYTPRDTL
jgi:hypothetical protein